MWLWPSLVLAITLSELRDVYVAHGGCAPDHDPNADVDLGGTECRFEYLRFVPIQDERDIPLYTIVYDLRDGGTYRTGHAHGASCVDHLALHPSLEISSDDRTSTRDLVLALGGHHCPPFSLRPECIDNHPDPPPPPPSPPIPFSWI